MVPKCKLLESIPLHVQELNCGNDVYELENYVKEEALSSNLCAKAWARKKNFSCKFSRSPIINT